ncbi:diguanylate cyclase (GGDEF)-like protein [Jatrophihabitans sp. GAS493]|uniref:putative bifunctional diguanylate cyclase/phosphodiesterase n=1 Tax=Jatrophihabitans sp. GAS493 TaxID=1907575 RepID=UPI000BC0B659|nr:bifunctional diguanylate cyclase/phosphodiesterase [Jatrophihabitans sp. GAS493]SOD74096.1 diguanylate cyclase (GGDEF)-like protein [Jatrophihabitans sp. GAS493]
MSVDVRQRLNGRAFRHADSTRPAPGSRARSIWAYATRKPSVATPRVFAFTTGNSYLVAGLLGLLALAAAPVAVQHATALTVLSILALISGVIILAIGHLLPPSAPHVLLAVGTVLVAVSVSLLGDHPAAAVDGGIMFLAIGVGCAFYFSLVALTAHILLGEVCVYIAAQMVGLVESEIVYTQGLLVAGAVLVASLTRVAAAASRDSLTGLYSRRGFDDFLGRAIAEAQRGDQTLAVVVIDLDDFKAVNDISGHAEGDRLLASISSIWQRDLAPGLTMCRQGGDEFALILPGFTANRAAAMADQLRAVVRHETSFSAGVAEFRAEDSQSKLLGRADVALYNAKSAGGGQTCQYGVADDGASATEFYRALDDGEFEVYFQPILDLSVNEVIGDEALIRWNHPTRGLVAPLEFIPLAESSGAIHAIGGWVLREACVRTVAHSVRTGRPRSVSVNASGHELTNPDYAANVATVLAQTGLEPSSLIIEVTESTFDADHLRVLAVLRNLRELGVRIAIDDFGTGYSSLNRLEKLPANVLKIDRSFVAAIPDNAAEVPVLRAIVAMATALKLTIVAEGVETPRQAHVLTELGCSHAQGYFFGRPAPEHQDTPANSIQRRRTAMRQHPTATSGTGPSAVA